MCPMRIIFMIALCGILSANVCQNVTLDLYDAAVAYERDMNVFGSVLPAGSSKPDTVKVEEALRIVKSMRAKCTNMIDHKDPSIADAKKALEIVTANDAILQKSGSFAEPGLVTAQKKAVDASTKLMALLAEFPQPIAAKASPAPASPKNNDEDEDGNDEDDSENGDDEDEDDEDEDEEDEDGDDEDEDEDEEA